MTDGWVRVHSDEDEDRPEEAMLTSNLIATFVESILAPGQDIDGDPGWWDSHPGLYDRVEALANQITGEHEGYVSPRLLWWIKNNADVEAGEGLPPSEAIERTIRAFVATDDPHLFDIPQD